MIKKTMTAAEAVAVAGTGAGAASGNPLLALRSAVVQRWLAFRSAAQATHPSRALVWNVAFGLLLSWLGWHLLNWAVFNASLSSDAGSCRLSQGACWGVIQEKGRLVLMGRYPQSEQWRPLLGCLLLLTSLAAAAHPRGFGKTGLVCVLASLGSFILLLAGGVFGLAVVPTELWGGLPLTLLLAMLACLAGLPLALMLALGRRSSRLLWRCLCTSWIELIRGVPLITLLFFGAFVVPLVMPLEWKVDVMIRISVCLTIFSAAYLAEVIRGGLQSVHRGQYEAAQALGLTRWQTLHRIVLPQAMRVSIAPVASNIIGAVKDTSLVAVVNIYDLTGALKLAMSDPEWRPYFIEMYGLVSLIYLLLGVAIAHYGRFLERRYALK